MRRQEHRTGPGPEPARVGRGAEAGAGRAVAGRRRDLLRLALPALGLCVVSLLAVAPAEAAPPSGPAPEAPSESKPNSAHQWYERGIELGTAGEFLDAAAAFLRSYALQPTSEALFNAGVAFEQADDPIAAVETYGRFLAEPDPNPAYIEAAKRSIEQLERQLGVLKGVRYDPSRPPAALYIDGTLRALDELPLLLRPGPVVVEVVNEEGLRQTETYELAAGEALVVDLRALLLPAPAPVPVGLGPVAPEPEPRAAPDQGQTQLQAKRAQHLRKTSWAGLGSAAAFGVSAASFAGLATREASAYQRFTCIDEGSCPAGFVFGDPRGHLRAYEAYRLGARISAAVAGGLALGTLVVGLLSLRAQRKAERAGATVQLQPGLGGFTLRF